jgi:hypothetical protein
MSNIRRYASVRTLRPYRRYGALGMAQIALSALDSERFGLTIARAGEIVAGDVPKVLAFCRAHAVDMVIARCEGTDHGASRALTAAGLQLVEGLVVYRGSLVPLPPEPAVRPASAADASAVADIARAGFADYGGHYHADPRLPLAPCCDLYVDWAVRGVSGDAADAAFVAEVDGVVAAFGLWTVSGGEVTFQLSSVASWARGRGLYRAILRRGMAWGMGQGASTVIGIVAHGTVTAHRNLIAEGLRPVGGTSTFHGWTDRLV